MIPLTPADITQAKRWTTEHSKRAVSQGWNMFDYDQTGALQIQRLDEADVFTSDDEALSYAKGRAERGDETAKLALELDAYFGPIIYPPKRKE